MSGDKAQFLSLQMKKGGRVTIGDNKTLQILGKGKIGKQITSNHKAKKMVSTSKPLELLHLDLFGAEAYKSIGERGISHEFSALRTPQQNGVVEHKNRVYNLSKHIIEESIDVTFQEPNNDLPRDEEDDAGNQQAETSSPVDDVIVKIEKMTLDGPGGNRAKDKTPIYHGEDLAPPSKIRKTSYEDISKHSFPKATWTMKNHPPEQVIGDISDGLKTRKGTANFCAYAAFLAQEEPKNVEKALEDENWITDLQEELNKFERCDVWELVKPPKDASVIGIKWISKNKVDEFGTVTRNKARLVAQGYNQQEGIDFDQTYAPLARLESIRMLLAYACYKKIKLHQMDVKSAFLNGFLEEVVYVKQPPGFEHEQHPDYVYKLKKALYGLKQAPRACKLTSNEKGKDVDIKKYRGMIGSLLYLTASRPDIMYSVCTLRDFGIKCGKVPIYCDNTSTINISKNLVNHSRTKHIDVRHHFLRDNIAKEIIEDDVVITKARTYVKNPEDFSPAEKEEASLDASLQLILETIEVINEGTEEVRENKLEILTSEYEYFKSNLGEGITEVFERYNALINNLDINGKYYSIREVNKKFLLTLPTHLEHRITAIRKARDLSEISLERLYGVLKTYELELIQQKEVYGKGRVVSTSTALVAEEQQQQPQYQQQSQQSERMVQSSKVEENVCKSYVIAYLYIRGFNSTQIRM
ncbi:hypothetical protein AgCh_038388 [Apium graveolens]